MTPCVFNGGIPVNIGQQTKAESIAVVGWIGKSVNNNTMAGGMEYLPNTVVQLIVCYRAPALGFLVCHWLQIYTEIQAQRNELGR